MYNIHSYCKTHKGDKKLKNEDSYFIDNSNKIWCINDGIGGHKNGKFASNFLKDQIKNINFDSLTFEEKQEKLLYMLENTNRILYDLSKISGRLGTTNVSLIIDCNYALCVWAGDSRCYLKRGNELYMLSKDHTLMENNINKGIVRAIGAKENIIVDKIIFKIKPNDVILLCSDGVYNIIDDDELFKSITSENSKEITNRIFTNAEKKYRYDNLTAITITIT